VANPKILKRGEGGRQFISPFSFIANAHSNLLAFYTEKGGFLEKKLSL